MLQHITMVLFTYNRSYMIPEIVHYHAPTGINIIILDASEKCSSMQKWGIKSKNITYQHLPGTTHIERLKYVQEKISTQFFVFRADRRHYSNKFLFQGASFLQNNSEYASAAGIWLSEKDLSLYHCSELVSHNGELEDPYLRTENQVLSYQPSYYNVHRTENIRSLSNILSDIEKETQNMYYHEYVQAITTSLCGKTKQFHCLSGIIQDVKKEQDYSQLWPKATELFEDKKLSLTLAESIFTHLHHKGIDKKKTKKTVLQAMHNISLRFLFYRINIHQQTANEKNTYTYFQKIFSILNKNDINDNNNFIEKSLRILSGIAFEKDVKYNDIHQNFSRSDTEELVNILEVIDRCQKQKMLNEIRLTKMNIQKSK